MIHYIASLRVSDPVPNLQATAMMQHSVYGRGARRHVQGFGLKLRARCSCKQWSEPPAAGGGPSFINKQHSRGYIVSRFHIGQH